MRNTYEQIQWTLAIELRGSLLVYFWIGVTSAFTSRHRIGVFLILILYSIYFGDLLGEIPFYVGLLLANLSLALQNNKQTSSTIWVRRISILNQHWPIILFIFALTIGSFPAEKPKLAPWSRFFIQVGNHIFHSQCTVT